MQRKKVEDSVEDERYEEIVELSQRDPPKAITQFEDIILEEDEAGEKQKIKELSIYRLGELYVATKQTQKLKDLLVNIRPFFVTIPKAKTAKIVRTLIDLVAKVPDSEELQLGLCMESIEWCRQEKRTFLRQRIESRMADLYLRQKNYKDCMTLTKDLLIEIKKLDDKLLMVEVHLTESRVHLNLRNIPTAKASLTAGRALSNSVYCPPDLQAQIDMLSGIICAAEKDYKTGFSYFYEAFEGYQTVNDAKNAVMALKYMLLSKILTNRSGDVYSIISGKAGQKYVGREVAALKAVAEAHKKRSLHDFEDTLKEYKDQLVDDPIIHSHLNRLYETLLEQNLIRLIEPFSRVQISHVAELINMPVQRIESKLSEMILDKKFHGILDQGVGDLIIYDYVGSNKTYDAGINTVKELNNVVEQLYKKAQKLHQ